MWNRVVRLFQVHKTNVQFCWFAEVFLDSRIQCEYVTSHDKTSAKSIFGLTEMFTFLNFTFISDHSDIRMNNVGNLVQKL